MCTRSDPVSACLPKPRDTFDGPIGCYSNVGYYTRNPQVGTSLTEAWHTIYATGCPPERYAEYAREWKKMEAQITGGCLRCRSRAHRGDPGRGKRGLNPRAMSDYPPMLSRVSSMGRRMQVKIGVSRSV